MAEFRAMPIAGGSRWSSHGCGLGALLAAGLLAYASLWAAEVSAPPAAREPANSAAESAHALDWPQLGASEQQALAPLRAQWSQLPPRQQQRFRNIAARWASAPAPQRAAIEQRIARWAAMTPEQRAALRARYEQFRQLGPEQQQQLRAAFQRFRALPPDQRTELRARFEQMTPAERAAFAAGAEAAQRSHGWQRFMAEVPPEQRAKTRAMWQSFDPAQRRTLGQHMKSLSASERSDLRTRLLAMTPIARNEAIAHLPAPRP